MQNMENRVGEFLSSEDQVKALAGDKGFISSVAGGKATSEDYAKEFKRFGIELSDSEAEDMKSGVDKLIKAPSGAVEDEALKLIAGGNGHTISIRMPSKSEIKNGVLVGGAATTGVAGLASVVFLTAALATDNYSARDRLLKLSGISASAAAAALATTVAASKIPS